MTAALTAVSIAAVAFAVLAFWLAWEHAEQRAQIETLKAARDEAEVARDQARILALDAAEREAAWHQTADINRRMYDDEVEHTRLIAKGADDLAAELTTLQSSPRCLPDLATQRRAYWGIEDAPIYAAVRAGAA